MVFDILSFGIGFGCGLGISIFSIRMIVRDIITETIERKGDD